MHLKVAVCPHDSTKNKVHWLYFITFLSQKVGLDLTMEQCFDFDCYYKSFPKVDMTYSNPLDALKIHLERGFVPVAGNDNYDEVVIIASRDADKSLEAMQDKEVLCVENQFASYLGMKILKEKGIRFKVGYRGSWQNVLSDVSKGKAPYGFLYKDFWDQMSDFSQRDVIPIYVSDEKLSSHLIMLSPELAQYRQPILWALEEMPKDKEGAKILEQLRVSRWYPVESLDYLKKLTQEA
jgi:ABC-type phosphate/phosphonate transport system substrate-binding protein